jgi:pimeloyl-ACP methyl ester carboxylesterase
MTMPRGSDDACGRFVSAQAEREFLSVYDALCAQRWPSAPSQLEVATRFGPTHVFHWAGSGTPIVLLHGFAATSLLWHKAIEALSGHPVYAVDTIGEAGRSVQRAPIRDRQDLATWLEEVLGGLRLDRVHLVGASYGGWLALDQALRAPRRLATITLVEPGGFAKVGPRFFLWAIACGLATIAPGPIRRRAARWLRMSTLDDPPLLRMAMLSHRTYRPHRPRETALSDDELRSITVPALLLLGEKSELHPSRRVLARTRALMPALEGEIIPGAGHSLPYDQAEVVTRRILQFLAVEARKDAP